MSRRQPRPPDTGISPSPNPPGVGLEAAQPRISDPRQLGHRSDPGRRVRSAASRRAHFLVAGVSSRGSSPTTQGGPALVRARLPLPGIPRPSADHADRLGRAYRSRTFGGRTVYRGDRRGDIPTGSGPQCDRRRQRTRQRRPLRGEQRVNVEDVPGRSPPRTQGPEKAVRSVSVVVLSGREEVQEGERLACGISRAPRACSASAAPR